MKFKLLSGIIFIGFLLSSVIYANELTIFTLPENRVNPMLESRIAWQYPNGKSVLLNGTWDLLAPANNVVVGNVRVPFSFAEKATLVLQRQFEVDDINQTDYFLNLGVPVGDIKVWLNDSLIYTDNSNYLPLVLPLPKKFLLLKNYLRISIAAQNRRFGDLPGFYPSTLPRIDYGLLDGVYLIGRPKTRINKILLPVSVNGNSFSVSGKITLTLATPLLNGYRITVIGYHGDKQLWQDVYPLQNQTDIDLKLRSIKENTFWHTDQPEQYWVEAVLDSGGKVIDKVRKDIAVRQFSVAENCFLLDGKPDTVNGINYIYQNIHGETVFDPAVIRSDIETIKKMGYNAIRLPLHPMPEWFFQYCTEIGIMTFVDLPFVLWQNAHADPYQRRKWQQYVDYAQQLAADYSAVCAIGVAYYPNASDAFQLKQIDRFSGALKKNLTLPVYISSLLPRPVMSVEFQIVDILGRYQIERNLTNTQKVLSGQLMLPSGLIKPMTLRIDSTVIVQELLLSQALLEHIQQNPAKFPGGHFIPTYSDYYNDMPSIQNTHSGNPWLSRSGLFNLNRTQKPLVDFSLDEIDEIISPSTIREDQGSHSYIYVIIGFMNIFIFLITYRRYKIFRQSIGHSIRKPHGFFVSLQERIIIPYTQSFFVMTIISLNGALILSAFLYFYRNHFLADYLQTLFFYTPFFKNQMIRLVWDQAFCIVLFTFINALIFYISAAIIKLVAVIRNKRVLYNQALAISIWSASPMLFLLPLGVFTYSLLLMMKSYWIILGMLLYFHVWVYFRWVNGARVLTDMFFGRAFVTMTLFLGILLWSAGYLYDSQYLVKQHLTFVHALQQFWK
jgi:hypothetical protein